MIRHRVCQALVVAALMGTAACSDDPDLHDGPARASSGAGRSSGATVPPAVRSSIRPTTDEFFLTLGRRFTTAWIAAEAGKIRACDKLAVPPLVGWREACLQESGSAAVGEPPALGPQAAVHRDANGVTVRIEIVGGHGSSLKGTRKVRLRFEVVDHRWVLVRAS